MMKEENGKQNSKEENPIMRIRIKRKTFLTMQFQFKDMTKSHKIMDVIWRYYLSNHNPDLLDFWDNMGEEDAN